MAHPQHQIPLPAAPPPFSPAQLSPSPIPTPQTVYAAAHPPPKRQRMSPTPGQSQPGSPYIQSPSFAPSPGAAATPPSHISAPSPNSFSAQIALPPTSMAQQQPVQTPYINGNTHNNYHVQPKQPPTGLSMPNLPMPSLAMPPRQNTMTPVASPGVMVPPASTTPLTPAPVNSPYATTYAPTNATLMPMAPLPAAPGTMGPPSKPVEKKEVQYDVHDAMAGTGIDLREEEQYMLQFYAGTIRPDARTGFPANPPGGSASMYGAGLANQPGQYIGSIDQTQFVVEQAKNVWSAAATKLASVRSQEIYNPFTRVGVLHNKATRIAKEYGISVVLDHKSSQQGMGKMKMDHEFPEPSVHVSQKVVGDDVIVTTSKSFLPADSFLAEQIGLLSIATRHRVRQLIEDADRIARTRQQTSHGIIPPEWKDASAPVTTVDASLSVDTSATLIGSPASPRANPLKRPHGAGTSQQASINLGMSIREQGKQEREAEEARLRKRQKRVEDEERKKKGGDSATVSRAGSVAPGTPGAASIAPEAPKLTKKEEKARAAQSRSVELMNTASANSTMSHFLGGKSKKKKYGWLSSGASTPRTGAGTPAAGAAGGGPGRKEPQVVVLTKDDKKNKIGNLRENDEKNRNIQLRDWVTVLESDKLEVRALQLAYDKLDSSS